MAKTWKKVARLYFTGPKYQDHALDLGALKKLSQFQKMVEETAKELWRTSNPDRERLPPHFEECTRLYLRTIEEGSAIVPLEVGFEEEPQASFLEEESTEVEKAIDMVYEVFQATEQKKPLPDQFPQELIDDYLNWGQEILDDEEIQFEPINKKKINITRTSFDHLSKFSDRSYEDQVTLKGEVLEADVKQKRFQLWIDDKTKIQINFSDEQETEVTTALKEHKNLFLEVRGTGEFYPSGKIKFIRLVERLQITPKSEKLERKPSKKIGDIFDQFSSKVPPEEWNKLPKDLNENLDHYIYRMPKR